MNLTDIYNNQAIVETFTIFSNSFVVFQVKNEHRIADQLRRLGFYGRKVLFREVNNFEEMDVRGSYAEKVSGSSSLVYNADVLNLFRWNSVVVMFMNNHIRMEFYVCDIAEVYTLVSSVHVSHYVSID